MRIEMYVSDAVSSEDVVATVEAMNRIGRMGITVEKPCDVKNAVEAAEAVGATEIYHKNGCVGSCDDYSVAIEFYNRGWRLHRIRRDDNGHAFAIFKKGDSK